MVNFAHISKVPLSPSTPGCGLLHLSIPYTFSAHAKNLRGGFYPSIASPQKPLLRRNWEIPHSIRDIKYLVLIFGWEGVFVPYPHIFTTLL